MYGLHRLSCLKFRSHGDALLLDASQILFRAGTVQNLHFL